MSTLELTILTGGTPTRVSLYPVFLWDNGTRYLEWMIIHPSGKVTLGQDEFTLDDIRSLIEEGTIHTSLAKGDRVYIRDLISVVAGDVLPIVKDGELLGEVRDIIRERNGEPTTSDRCRDAYARFLRGPSEENRLLLKAAYERVPDHLRVWLCSFDEKDIPIRRAVYGESWRREG